MKKLRRHRKEMKRPWENNKPQLGVNILGKNIRNPGKTKSEGNENEMKVFKENKAALN